MDIMGEKLFERKRNMFTKEQFTSLAKKHMDMVFRLAFSYLRSREEADDVTQNVLLALWRTDKRFASAEHVKAWLIRVTVNECKKVLRSPWRKREDLAAYENALAFETEEDRALYDAVMALDAKYRAVIVLYYYEGYSIAEIGKLLGVPAPTVGTRLSRARERLKDMLTEAESDE